jgi:hypothetical protein
LRLVSGAWSLLKHAKAVIPAGRTLWKFTETASVCACKFFGKCCRGAWSALKFAFAGLKKSVAFVCGGVWSPLKKISAVPFAIVCAAKGVSLRLVSGAWSLLKHAKAVIPAVQSLWKFTKAAAKLASCFGAKCCVKIAPLLRKAYPFFCALLRRCWAFLRTWTVRVGVQLLALLHCVARVPSAGYRLLLKFSMAPRESIAMALQRLRRLRVHGAATEKKAPSSDSAVKLSPLKRIAASRVVPSFHPKNFAKLCKGLPLLPLRFAGKIAKFIGEKTIFVATKLMDTLFGTASVAKSVCSKSATAAKSIGPHAAAISNYARVALLMPAKLRLIAFLAICRNYAVGCASAAKNIGHKSLKFSRNGSMRCAGFAWNFLRILWRIAAKVAVFSLVQLRSAFSLCAAGVRKLCLCVASACSRFRLLLARQFESGWTQILNLVQRPAIVLPIAFTVITFLGLYTYDRQVLRMEYGKAKYAARQSKNLLRQKRHAMRGYTDENPSPRRKVRSSNGKHAAALGAATIKTADDLQRAVDEFFSHHVVSQIMCDGGSCRMKIDNKIVGDHGMLGENSGVFVAEADDDCVTFTDALGNRYSKTIASLLGL